MKPQKRNTDTFGEVTVTKAPKGTKYASKKNYFSRNKDGAVSHRNRDRRLAKVARRAAYWATPAGKARKFEKMNTPEKAAKAVKSKQNRDARRRERKLAEQSVKAATVVATQV